MPKPVVERPKPVKYQNQKPSESMLNAVTRIKTQVNTYSYRGYDTREKFIKLLRILRKR